MIILGEIRPENSKRQDALQDACSEEARAWKPMLQQRGSSVLSTLHLA